MQTFTNKQEADYQLIVRPLLDAGLDPAEYDTEKLASKILGVKKGKYYLKASGVHFWVAIEDCAL